ncbi:Telomere reverse transcriptase [Penicillium brevicompactum]|uniref:Telomere reverse transcriptase n=1 Tax=Penicillium brevicompactum TaxID=5074 RepID=UPI00253F7161|nr:Telomere reverse transcriptase [Penicillium brevicompactum]KAJ5325627.1 Telomere reverse transcriptase [Penicillium brevicompactum]
MGKKRKRPVKDRGPTPSSHLGITTGTRRFRISAPNSREISHPVISLYYQQVLTLRDYLLHQLPLTSKSRRRRIWSLGSPSDTHPQSSALAQLLDSTLVGVLKNSSPSLITERQKEYLSFNESQSRSLLVSTDTGPTCPQSEVVDFVIWKLFNQTGYGKPQNLLANGFQRPSVGLQAQDTEIPGVVSRFPNHSVATLKGNPWTEVLGLLGINGEDIMMRLLFDCGVFAPINAQKGVYYQLSGLPLPDLEVLSNASNLHVSAKPQNTAPITDPKSLIEKQCHPKPANHHGPNSIVFLRRRILYGRIESKREMPYVFNRFSSLDSQAQTVHVMKYMFPRQFGLHNVFMPQSDGRNSTIIFKSGIFREKEISQLDYKRQLRQPRPENESADADAGGGVGSLKVPKRLRGMVETVRKLRNRNAQCSYSELLRYYCPTEKSGPAKLGAFALTPEKSQPISSLESKLVTQVQRTPEDDAPHISPVTLEPHQALGASCGAEQSSRHAPVGLIDYATPPSSVSAFCRAVFQKLISRQLLGDGPEGTSNYKVVMRHIDRFIKMRRFESMSLHEVCKGVKITCIAWLEPPQTQTSRSETRSKIALSDLRKRTELLHEFIYWIFESLIIPLIRSTFYVTESQTHRNRLFYFRHDVWQQLIEQPFGKLKATMFEELEPERAKRVLARKSLGYGALRLLPKSTGIRPILNLRKRVPKESTWGKNQTFLAPSINTSITPIYNMLTYERLRAPAKLGSTLLSVGDIHYRLKTFKEQLSGQLKPGPQSQQPKFPPLYFVKLDIQACFDTIPQAKLLNLIADLVSGENYRMSRHVEFQPPLTKMQNAKPTRRFLSRAALADNPQHLPDFVKSGPSRRKANAVFVDLHGQKDENVEGLMALLDEHVRSNLVQMGKKFFRQRNGIPQGSVLSSILCNFFYAELERNVLGFIDPKNSLLLRLVDDFLLITPKRDVAMRFVEVMIGGQPSYGVRVNPAKSMANFSAAVDGIFLPRLEGSNLFPYCGTLISTHTLELHRDQDRQLESGETAAATISNTLTVEATRFPGRTFNRKVLSTFRLQLHSMYIDDGHNSRMVVLENLYASFMTSAMKMYRYMKSLRGRAHPSPAIVTQTIRDLVELAANSIQGRRVDKDSSFSCFVQVSQLKFLAAAAFRFVLKRKQTKYVTELRWLGSLAREARPTSDSATLRMTHVVKKGNAMFETWRF